MDISRVDIHPDNYGGINRGRRYIILHANGASTESSINWFKDPDARVSYHYLVTQDGVIFQFVDEGKRAWHAGVSRWQDDSDLNDLSVGIAVESVDGTESDLTALQINTLRTLIIDIAERHGIPTAHVLAHKEVSPGRKVDPIHINMPEMRKSLDGIIDAPHRVGTLVLHGFGDLTRRGQSVVLRGDMVYRVRGGKLDVRLEGGGDGWQGD